MPHASTGVVIRSWCMCRMKLATSARTSIMISPASTVRSRSIASSGVSTIATSAPASRAISAARASSVAGAPITNRRTATLSIMLISVPTARSR
ncbi:hypothetical protein [uncultured Sphingomonas sp.]|uniref:hypothetical protein n=1 Tax=uncultured Sphingomonas sp. TaxID=158754 RepID=UPI0035CA51D7